MFQIGDRVIHHGHGPGTVVGYNETPRNDYFYERPREVLEAVEEHPILAAGLVESLYSSDRYPYLVTFDSGYQDVYSEREITPL